MVRIFLYVKGLRSNVKGELLISLSDTQTSRKDEKSLIRLNNFRCFSIILGGHSW